MGEKKSSFKNELHFASIHWHRTPPLLSLAKPSALSCRSVKKQYGNWKEQNEVFLKETKKKKK